MTETRPNLTETARTNICAQSTLAAKPREAQILAPFIALAAWIVPGMGHLLVRPLGARAHFLPGGERPGVHGFLAKGQVFPPHSDDPFGTLGFLADACSGVFFVLAHLFEKTGPDVSRAAGDYGTRFVAAAGVDKFTQRAGRISHRDRQQELTGTQCILAISS